MVERTMIDGVDVRKDYILFPYEKIEKDSDIILYGAGDIGSVLNEQIKKNKYCRVVAFGDMAAREKKMAAGMPKCILPEEIQNEKFDYVVLAKTRGANLIAKDLEKLGIPKEKLVILDDSNVISMSMSRFAIDQKYDTGEQMISDYQMNESEDNIYSNNSTFIQANSICTDKRNLIDWYEFDSSSSLLIVGADYGDLTKALCERVRWVTLVEEDETKKKMNSLRCTDKRNLQIVADENEALLNRYDYIVLYGRYANDTEQWKKCKGSLNINGVMIIVGDNKYKLEHWATKAERIHKDKVFEGIDIKLLEQWKLDELPEYHLNYFYPVPSYHLPERIYTKDYQPEFSSIRGGNTTHLDMNLVNDALELSGCYWLLPDSYLLILEPETKEYPLYINYKRKRKKQFRIETRINRDKKQIVVQKRALCEQAAFHVQNMLKSKEILESRYLGFGIIPGKFVNETTIEFPYVEGQTLDQFLWDNHENRGVLVETIRKYCEKCRNVSEREQSMFEICDEFKNVFGNVECRGLAMKYANVDAIFDNIILAEDQWLLFDYEWVFSFFVPVNFVIYRAIEVFTRKYKSYLDERLVEEIWNTSKLTKEECEKYQIMNLNLWKYFTEKDEKRASFEK